MHPAIYKEVMEQRAVDHAQTVSHGGAAGMLCPMDAARRCEFVADTTQAPVKQATFRLFVSELINLNLKLCEARFQTTARSAVFVSAAAAAKF